MNVPRCLAKTMPAVWTASMALNAFVPLDLLGIAVRLMWMTARETLVCMEEHVWTW